MKSKGVRSGDREYQFVGRLGDQSTFQETPGPVIVEPI